MFLATANCHDSVRVLWPGFNLPTGPAKPVLSGTGLPVRLGRKPVGTGGIQIWIQMAQFNRFVPVYRPVW